MKKIILILIILIVGNKIFGQISQEGTPRSFNSNKRSSFTKIPTIKMDPIDKNIIKAIKQDNNNSEKNDYQFAYGFSVNINVKEVSMIDSIDVGVIYRFSIESDSAYSINLIFKKYILPIGAELYIYSEDHKHILGAFTSRNNKERGRLPIMPVKGDKIIVEYFEPYFSEFKGELIIGKINHDFLGIIENYNCDDSEDYFGESADCNININCPEGEDWQDEKRSVCHIITKEGTSLCTGALINNTSYDGTPYFLTANHCIANQDEADDVCFVFNYESSSCPGHGNNGSISQVIAGATLVANNSNSDFALLKLSFKPFTSFNSYYAGWDNSGEPSSSGASITHPRGDVKKIAIYNQNIIKKNNDGAYEWKVIWKKGTVEPGSSGGPLFDSNKKIIGQLRGGQRYYMCKSDDHAFFSRFDVSWNASDNPNKRLKNWLDPLNSGVTSLNGVNSCPDNSTTNIDLSITHTINSGAVEIYRAKNTITATNTIESGAIVTYEAGDNIYLKSSFRAKAGCNFVARIKPLECVSSCDPIIVNSYPSIFTPNGDGYNDYLCYPVKNATSFDFSAYNKWGNLIYSNSDRISGNIACVWGGSNSCVNCTYTVIVTFKNDCDEISKAYTVTVKGESNKTVTRESNRSIQTLDTLNIKLNNQFNDFDFNIYPNPTKGKFIIEINNKEINNYSLEIFNSVGISLYKINNLIQDKIEINKNTFIKGIYYIRLNNKYKIITKKLVIN